MYTINIEMLNNKKNIFFEFTKKNIRLKINS